MSTISKFDAYNLAKKAGIRFGSRDPDVQSMSAMVELAAIAKLAGYKKPASASGSTARYFYCHLLKLKDKRGWD